MEDLFKKEMYDNGLTPLLEKQIKESLNKLYDQAIDHAIKTLDNYNTGTDYSKKRMIEDLIFQLQQLKYNKE